MRPLDGLRDVFLYALAHSKYTYAEKVVLVERWNDAVHELEKHYDIKGMPGHRRRNEHGRLYQRHGDA